MDSSPDTREYSLEDVRRLLEKDPNPPDLRAGRVMNALAVTGKFTNWDALCFAAEYIGAQSVFMPWLKEPAKEILRLLYLAHVFRFGDIAWLDQVTLGGPSTTDGQHTPGPSTSSSDTSKD